MEQRNIKPAVALALAVLLVGCRSSLPASPTKEPQVDAVASVQRYLAGEHAAIWAYGRATGLLPDPEMREALKALARHKQEREQLETQLRSAGVAPVGTLVSYFQGSPLKNAEQARHFLADVEARLKILASAVKSIPNKS